tara:strand:- start:476 stop:1081 length:606 start_codon:yes stop_codon:yes gene_type:complete
MSENKEFNIDWNFIAKKEGGQWTNGYVPSENSGVTIATGFDLKMKTADDLKAMGIPEPLINKLIIFTGISGSEAKEKAKDLQITSEEANLIDKNSKRWYANKIAEKYFEVSNGKNFKDLTMAQQTVITSVGFNHGVSFTRKDGKQMDFIKQAAEGDWTAMIANLRNFGDNPILKPRRLDEANYLEDSLKKKPIAPAFDVSP